MALQLSAALFHVHGHDVVHLDIKPRNVLVYQEAGFVEVKLTDFGSALTKGQVLDCEKMYECTRPFRAPELMVACSTNKHACPAMDLWSVGVLFWDVFPTKSERSCANTRAHPFVGAGNSAEQLVLALALVGCSRKAAQAWGLVDVDELEELAPWPYFFEVEELQPLRPWIASLLQADPACRVLPLLSEAELCRDSFQASGAGPLGGAPSEVEDADERQGEVEEVEEAGDAVAVAGCSESAVIDAALNQHIQRQKCKKQRTCGSQHEQVLFL